MKPAKSVWITPLLALICMLAANVIMLFSPIGQPLLLQYDDGSGMLDLMLHYNGVQASAALASLGVEGSFVYTRLLLIDFVFILSSALFFYRVMQLLLNRLGLSGVWRSLPALGYLRSVFDAAENILILLSMHLLHNGHGILTVASFASALKWLSLLAYLFGALIAMLYAALRRARQGK